MKNASQNLKTDEILAARALFVICTRVKTLHLCYMKNATVFSQSDACNFFMYVISAQIGLVISNHVPEFCLLVLIKHNRHTLLTLSACVVGTTLHALQAENMKFYFAFLLEKKFHNIHMHSIFSYNHFEVIFTVSQRCDLPINCNIF